MSTFNYSGFKGKVLGNIVSYHRSFVGRDYKAWAQMAPFVMLPYLSDGEREVWINLSKVFRIAYCVPIREADMEEYDRICKQFVNSVKEHMPDVLQKQKIHMILHLPECIRDFGPTSCFNTERCEAFNSRLRNFNIFSNRAASSRDIAVRFTLLEDIRLMCDGGTMTDESRSSRTVGAGLIQLYHTAAIQRFLNGVTRDESKAIFNPGVLRKKQKTMIPIGEVNLKLSGQCCTLNTLPNHATLIMPRTTHTTVTSYGAVMSSVGQLVNCGQYVKLDNLYKYGVLLANIQDTETLVCLCLLRPFEEVTVNNDPLKNDIDCPLLNLTNTIVAVIAQWTSRLKSP